MIYRRGIFLGYNVLFPLFNGIRLLRKRDKEGIRNCCVYLWTTTGIVYYIGEGVHSRPFDHDGDLVSDVIDSDWTCIILVYNVTKLEACIIEAKLLSMVQNRTFTRRGIYIWDGESLLNKQREYHYRGVSYEYLFKEYLNNGNYYWKALWREINRN